MNTILYSQPFEKRDSVIPKKAALSKIFIINTIIILIVLAAREFFSIAIPQYPLLAFVLVYAIFAKYENLVYYSSFLSIIGTGLNGGAYIILLVLLLIKSRHITTPQWIFTLIIACMELILMLFSDYTVPYNKYFAYIGILGFFLFLLFDRTPTIDQGTCLKLYCISTGFVLSCILLRTLFITGDVASLYETRIGYADISQITTTDNLQLFSLNPNSFGYFSVTAYGCLLVGRRRLMLNLLLYYLLFPAILIPAAFTISRTWLILTLLITLIYLIKYFNAKKIAIILIAIFAGGSSFLYLSQDILNNFEERLTSSDVKTGNGRTELFHAYNEYLSNNPDKILTGTSLNLYKEETKVWHSTHNGTQQIYLSYGILGMVIFIIIPIIFYKQFILHKTIKLLYYLPTIGGLIFLQTIQFLDPNYLMIPLIFCGASIKLGANRQ